MLWNKVPDEAGWYWAEDGSDDGAWYMVRLETDGDVPRILMPMLFSKTVFVGLYDADDRSFVSTAGHEHSLGVQLRRWVGPLDSPEEDSACIVEVPRRSYERAVKEGKCVTLTHVDMTPKGGAVFTSIGVVDEEEAYRRIGAAFGKRTSKEAAQG